METQFVENIEILTKRDLFLQNIICTKSDVSAYSKLYETELFKDIRYPKGVVYEDTATTYKLIEKCDKIATGNKKCYFYCTRPDSISKMKGFNKNELDYIKNTDEMLAYIKRKVSRFKRGC